MQVFLAAVNFQIGLYESLRIQRLINLHAGIHTEGPSGKALGGLALPRASGAANVSLTVIL